jgi:hypothetical protein
MAKVRANLQGQANNTIGFITELKVITTAPATTTTFTVGADGIIVEDVPAAVATVLCNMDGRRFKLVQG